MATRVLIVVLFVLSVLTSSAVTYLLISKSGVAAGGDIGKSVAEFIENNPEVIIQGLRKAQMARAEKESRDSDQKAQELRPQLEQSKTDPQHGNADADVTIVSFHDHNCGYCRRSIPDVEKLITEDKGVRLVMKDFPILGPLSVEKAKASLAVSKLAPQKWNDFYVALGSSNTQTVEQVIDLAVEKTGVNANLLRSEMESRETTNKISENRALGEQLGITGTPVFVINGVMVRGAAGYEAFKATVSQVRAGS